MKAIVEEINSVQRRVKVTVPSEAVNKAFSAYFQRVQGKAKIHGFRPGKAPMTIIKKMYSGSGAYDIVDSLVREHLLSAIRESGVRAISQPYLESAPAPVENESLEMTAIVDILPEIQLGDAHKNLSVSYNHYEADDHMLEHRLEDLAREHARLKAIEGEAKCEMGDLVRLSCVARMDGAVVERLSTDSRVVELGKKHLPSPEVEAAMLGMKIGETKTISNTFNGPNVLEEYRNKTISFEMTVLDIKRFDIPAIDAEFAKDLQFESVDAMKEAVRGELASEYERANQDAVHNALLTELTEKVQFEVPPSITDQVIDHIISQMRYKNDSERQKALTNNELRNGVLPEAKMRAKNTMVLHELIREEKLTASDEDLRQEVAERVQVSDPEVKEREISRNLKEFGESIREQVLFNKALQFLVSHAKIQKVPVVHDHSHDHDHSHHDHDHSHHHEDHHHHS